MRQFLALFAVLMVITSAANAQLSEQARFEGFQAIKAEWIGTLCKSLSLFAAPTETAPLRFLRQIPWEDCRDRILRRPLTPHLKARLEWFKKGEFPLQFVNACARDKTPYPTAEECWEAYHSETVNAVNFRAYGFFVVFELAGQVCAEFLEQAEKASLPSVECVAATIPESRREEWYALIGAYVSGTTKTKAGSGECLDLKTDNDLKPLSDALANLFRGDRTLASKIARLHRAGFRCSEAEQSGPVKCTNAWSVYSLQRLREPPPELNYWGAATTVALTRADAGEIDICRQ
jgi:hypothetical protein